MFDRANGGNGTGGRSDDGMRGHAGSTPPDPAGALALIDEVLRSHGADPRGARGAGAWRRLKVEGVEVHVGLIEMEGAPYLFVFSPVMRLPPGPGGEALAVMLLELNYDSTAVARFSVCERIVHVVALRPIEGLDWAEVDDAIATVMSVSIWARKQAYPDWLQYAERQSVPSRQLPAIPLAPKQWEALSEWFRQLNRKARSHAKEIIQAWGEAGFEVAPRKRIVELALPGRNDPSPLLDLGYDDCGSLRVRAHVANVPPEAVRTFSSWAERRMPTDRYGDTVVIKPGAKTTVTLVRDLARELVLLGAASGGSPESVPAPKKTQRQLVLEACDPHVRSIYLALMEGWTAAGGEVRSTGKGRVSLQWVTGMHEGGVVSREIHILSLATLTPPKGEEPAAINVAWGLAGTSATAYLDAFPKEVAEFESEVARLPGWVAGRRPKIAMGEGFTKEHAESLLKAMAKLMRAEQEAFRARWRPDGSE